MRRLVIAVDCDDVLVRTTPFFLNAYNEKYGTNVTLAETQDEHYPSWQTDPENVNARWKALMDTDGYRELGPDPEEAIILREIAKHHELHLITARKEDERAFTQEMLDRELAGVFTSMEFVGWRGSKGEVCARIGADVMIDDNPSHLHNAIEYGLPEGGAILFGNYPWNEMDQSHPWLQHATSWLAVKVAIDAIAASDVQREEA